ncbi:DUF1761 domain-containing protein [Candidatus Parcubacteria bacterium]|nr:DUF1761 domain-containing protein [Candidatus Parcubacteria bacterium]
MLTYSVSVWGVIIAAFVAMVIGMIWYSPFAFGKKWMALVGMTPDMMAGAKSGARTAYSISAVVSLIMMYVLGLFISNMFTPTLGEAIRVGFLAWLGFAATSMSAEYLYSVKQKPWSLYVINAGYQLAIMLAGSIILYFFMS